MSENMSEDTSERMSEDMSERMSKNMSERMSEDMSDRMSEQMSERMSEGMADRMPERFSEYTPLYVVVGITRSKGIVILEYVHSWVRAGAFRTHLFSLSTKGLVGSLKSKGEMCNVALLDLCKSF